MDRCITLTISREQCCYSASWVDADSSQIVACKTHADMLILEGHRMIKIKPRTINIDNYRRSG